VASTLLTYLALANNGMQTLADYAIKWWVAEGRDKNPGVEASMIRELVEAARRPDQAPQEETGDPAEGKRWPNPIIRPWWYMRPMYYKFDFDACAFVAPLRPDPRDKLFAREGSTQHLRLRPHKRPSSAAPSAQARRDMVTRADLTKRLFKSAYKGQSRRVRACVRAGAYINATDFNHPERFTPFLWAACGGSRHTLEALAQLGADVEVRDAGGRHALHIAAAHGCADAAEAIYNLTDGNLYARDNQDRLAVHVAALEGETRVLELLVELGSNVNAYDTAADSPLHLACRNGHEETARRLVWHGADPWQRNGEGKMAIDVAEEHWHKGVYYLLEAVMGEKCIFDRLPDAMFRCGRRHADNPVELYHRCDVEDLAPYAAPEMTPWHDAEEALRELRRVLTEGGGEGGGDPALRSAAGIYNNPDVWEKVIKTPVDLFPGEGKAGVGCNGDGGEERGGGGGGEEDSFDAGAGEWISYGVDPTKPEKPEEPDKCETGEATGAGKVTNAETSIGLAGHGVAGAERGGEVRADEGEIVWHVTNVTAEELGERRVCVCACACACGSACVWGASCVWYQSFSSDSSLPSFPSSSLRPSVPSLPLSHQRRCVPSTR
jgi:hypothetical protein